MIKKGIFIILASVLALLVLVGCQGGSEMASNNMTQSEVSDAGAAEASITDVMAEDSVTSAQAITPASAAALLAENEATLEVAARSTADAVTVTFNGDSIAVKSDGVTIDGSTATITAAGNYVLSGTLDDGQIIVDTDDEATVQLTLNGVDIRSSTSAPIALMNSEQVVLVLTDGSANYVEDASAYTYLDPEEEEPGAAIFSNDGLTITGNGSLTVNGNYNDAISSNDGIIIDGGSIAVTAVDDGIRGKDYLLIRDGAITVNVGGDGLKSDKEEDAALGFVALEAGSITITAGGDAMQAETDVMITGGDFALVSGGGSAAKVAADASAKGIKGVANVLIDGGTFTIDAADDAIHSNGNITINGGTVALASGDDGIHADTTVTINGGEIDVAYSYEGIESAVITVNDGDIHVVATEDGISVAGGADGSGAMPGPGRGRGGPAAASGETFTYTGDYYLYINGGTIVVDAAGDGLDANGAIEMTDGVVLVNGPTEQMNSALDYDGTFNISGGFFVAVGSADMAQAPGGASTQNSVLINFSSVQPAGTLINIRDSAGDSILTFAPTKAYQSVTFSSDALAQGEAYTVSLGGSAGGTAADGLYTDGTYSPGTEYNTFTISSVTTTLGGGTFGQLSRIERRQSN